MTTIALSRGNADVLAQWKRVLGIKTMDGLISRWIDIVKRKHQQDFYRSLPIPENKAKALKGKKIRGIYKKR